MTAARLNSLINSLIHSFVRSKAFPDRAAMYKYGSVFYGLMFVVTYPMFVQFESQGRQWSLARVVLHSLAATALVCCASAFAHTTC